MRIQDEKRIGPGDDLGSVVRWEAGDESIELFTSHQLSVRLERDDLAAVRAALDVLDRRVGR